MFSLTWSRWCVEGDLRTVRTEHGVSAASNSEGVQGVRLQVMHYGVASIHPVRGPPEPTVFSILLRWGLARAYKSGHTSIISWLPPFEPKRRFHFDSFLQVWSPPAILEHMVICR